jgi:hypothetical protein
MGSNQFLLIALCFIVIGASIRIGINQFKASEIGQNKDDLITSMQTIATNALVYRTKGKSIGGGKGSYVGFKLPKKKSSNNFGSYKVSISKDKITVTATSKLGYGTIALAYDKNGQYVKKSLKYTGTFK